MSDGAQMDLLTRIEASLEFMHDGGRRVDFVNLREVLEGSREALLVMRQIEEALRHGISVEPGSFLHDEVTRLCSGGPEPSMQSRRRGTMSGDAAETRPMDRTLACGCRFLRGSVFPCDAHQGGSLIRALLDELDELDRRRGTMTDDDHPELHTITMAVREADRHFERVGGSSRHWVRDCFLPMLEKHGLRIARLLDGIEEVPYRTPACDKHLSRNEEHECPWCKLDAYANEEICLECGRVGPKPPPPAISCCPERRTIRRAELEAENERLASRLDCARRLAHSWIDTPFTSMDRDTMRTLGNELLRTIGEKWIAESNPGSAVEKPVHPRYTRCPGTIDGEHQWERWENESTGETGMECAVCHDGYPTLSE